MDNDFIISVLKNAKHSTKDPRIHARIELGIEYIKELKAKISFFATIAICTGTLIVICIIMLLLEWIL